MGPFLPGLIVALGVTACEGDPDLGWARFNAPADALEVRVGVDDPDPIGVDIRSSTGAFVVGEATLTPGAGPVGTEHRLVVVVAEDYEEVVGRVTVRTDAGDRGHERFELVQDSAEPGYWELALTSVGVVGEQRVDTLQVSLWQEVPAEEADTAAGEAW